MWNAFSSALSLIALVGALLLATLLPAKAQDTFNDGFGTMPTSFSNSWAGCYLGANIGGADSSTSVRRLAGTVTVRRNGSNGVVGGLHGGCNMQDSWVVLGFEGDVNWANSIDYVATARARLGVAVGQMLFYGTAGWAFIDRDFRVAAPGFASKFGRSDTGYAAGGGVEFKIWQNVSLRGEAIYHGFNDSNVFVPGTGSVRFDHDYTVVRAGLTWHFGSGLTNPIF